MTTSSLCRSELLQNPGPHTAPSLTDLLRSKNPGANVSPGAVSGWLSRAEKVGALSVANVDGLYTYAVTDKKKLQSMVVREGIYAGGTEGRRVNRGPARRLPSLESIQSRLLDIAAEIERARTPLSAFSTEELIEELGRRARSQSKAA